MKCACRECPACIQADILSGKPQVKPVVYISGGITGVVDYEKSFEAARLELHKRGFAVLDPSTFKPTGYETFTWQQWIDYDLWVLRKYADSVFFLQGWSKSRGAIREHEESMAARKACFYQSRHGYDDVLAAHKILGNTR